MYEASDIREYSWGVGEAFGGGTINHYIVGPKGKVGYVRDISVDLTVATRGDTSVPEIQVGYKSTDSTYGRYRLGISATVGYAIGFWSASQEAITGNPPRNLQDYAGHVQLDGYPLGNAGIPGGTYQTVVPLGRIPASGNPITSIVNGTGNVWRIFLRDPLPLSLTTSTTGMLVNVTGVSGVTGGASNGIRNIAIVQPTAASLVANWIELTGITFGGTYNGGGTVDFVTVVTELVPVGTPTGTGAVRVLIEWVGANTP